MKRFTEIVLVVLSLVLMQSCNNRVGNITVRDYHIDQVVPEGLRSVRFSVAVEQHNDGATIKVNTMEGKLFRDGDLLGTFTLLQPVSLTGPGSCWADIKARVEMSENVSLLSAYAMIREADPSRYSVSFVSNVCIGKNKRNIKRDGIPLVKLVKFAQ